MRISLFLYIPLVCYMPILEDYIPKTAFGPGIPDIGAVRIFSYMLLLVFMFETAFIRRIRFFNKWTIFLAVYTFIVLLSVSWSTYSYTPYVIQRLFHTVMLPFAIAILAINIFTDKKSIHAYIINIMIASFILSLISIYQMAVGNTVVLGELRSTSTLGNPNSAAIFLVLSIPSVLYAMDEKMVPKGIGWIICVSLVAGIVSTVSRKGIITAVIAFTIYFFYTKQIRKIVMVFAITIVLSIMLAGYSTISGRFGKERFTADAEQKYIKVYTGLKMFIDRPIIGFGYKGYYENYGRYNPYTGRARYDAHNIFITALASYGIVGFMPFLGILFYPLLYCLRIIRENNVSKTSTSYVDVAILGISSIL
jgi:O-antigen ligase